jgi:HEAT repeat protein
MKTLRPWPVLSILVAACFVSGCGTDPPRSGGRTADYWAEVLKLDNVELRRKAAAKLGPLILIDDAALPALVGALKDRDAEVRAAAARSLGVYSGPKGPEVLAPLQDLQQNDANAKVRQAAAAAVERLTKGSG